VQVFLLGAHAILFVVPLLLHASFASLYLLYDAAYFYIM